MRHFTRLEAAPEGEPDAVKRGLETITESQFVFIRTSIRERVDDFYMSTQAAEGSRCGNSKNVANYINRSLVAITEI